MKFKTKLFLSIAVLTGIISIANVNAKTEQPNWWSVQSIDTVKYSRDVAKEKENDPEYDKIIEAQTREIANAGATHIAIGTPYDDEFTPFLRRWVGFARKYDLNVWFRGNFSGWEGWFGYEPISRTEHLELLRKFVTANGDLFESGDIFTSCPECENGGPGDPRYDTDPEGFRKFLIDEYKVARDSFRLVSKNVTTNYFPMNGDVARLIMDKETTKALGGVVVVDHYVSSPTQLAQDLRDLAKTSGGKVVLGEFGAPIPDIHGELTESEQAKWIEEALNSLVKIDDLIGINYWTSVGGSTALWTSERYAKKGVGVLSKYFIPKTFKGYVVDEAGGKIKNAELSSNEKSILSGGSGEFSMPFVDKNEPISITATGYFDQTYLAQDDSDARVVMVREKEGFFFLIKKFFYNLLFA